MDLSKLYFDTRNLEIDIDRAENANLQSFENYSGKSVKKWMVDEKKNESSIVTQGIRAFQCLGVTGNRALA